MFRKSLNKQISEISTDEVNKDKIMHEYVNLLVLLIVIISVTAVVTFSVLRLTGE